MLAEFFALIISYCGLFVGHGIAKIAKEEVRTGQKNLALLQSVLFIVGLVWFFYALQVSKWYKIIIAIILVLVVSFFKNNHAVLGVMIGLQPDLVMSSLVFLYGFPTGSLMKTSYKEIFKKTWIYFVFAALSFVIKSYLLG